MDTKTLPSQIIPDSQKGPEFVKSCLFAIKNNTQDDHSSKQKDIECWYYFHNVYNEKEFEYLTKIPSGTDGEADYYLPAKVRHIPIQRAKLNVLIGQQKHRPFQFSVSYIDDESVSTKQIKMIHDFVTKTKETIQLRTSEFRLQITQIEQQRNQLQSMASQQPKNEEEAMQQQQLQASIPQIDEQLNLLKSTLNSRILLTEDDISELTRYQKFKKTDWIDDMGQKVAKMVRSQCLIENKSLKNFISHIVTGKQQYYVDYEYGDKNITFETCNTNNIYYPMIEGIEWIQDGPWAMKLDMRSINYLSDRYALSAEEIKELENSTFENPSTFDFLNTEFGKNLNQSQLLYSGSQSGDGGIPEYKIWYRSQKKIQVKKSPNPHEVGKFFSHYLDDEDKVINDGQLYWDGKKKLYVDKDNGREYDKRDVINTTKGEALEVRYIDEIYQGVIIGKDIVKNAGRKPVRFYSNENYSYTVLPIIGKTFSDITNRPYSLVWDTKDIQKTYNLINFHRELLLATSGVKGTIMDISQMPEGMKKKEFIYYKKLGAMFIETMKKSGRQSSYNQFGSYDDTISASIQYIDNMLLMLDEMMGNIIGVTRQRQGQVSGADQVQTYTMGIDQANLITEIVYSDHDEVERRAFEIAVNLAGKYIYKNGGTFNYRTTNLEMESVTIPANLLNNIDLKIDIANNSLEERNLKELKSFAIGEYSKQLMPFRDLIKLYSSTTVKELETKFELITDEALKLAQENAGAQGQRELEIQSQLIKLKAELEAQSESQLNQLKQMELQMKGQLEQMKIGLQREQLQATTEAKKIDQDVKLVEIEANTAVETQYVKEQQRSNMVDEKLRSIQLEMDSIRERIATRQSQPKKSGGKNGNPMQHIMDN